MTGRQSLSISVLTCFIQVGSGRVLWRLQYNRLFVFCFCDRPLLFLPFHEVVGCSSERCHRRRLLERFGNAPMNFGISRLRIVRQLELGWTAKPAKPDLACWRLGHSIEPACGYNLATACEQAHFPGLEQFGALSNFAPVERLDL